MVSNTSDTPVERSLLSFLTNLSTTLGGTAIAQNELHMTYLEPTDCCVSETGKLLRYFRSQPN